MALRLESGFGFSIPNLPPGVSPAGNHGKPFVRVSRVLYHVEVYRDDLAPRRHRGILC